ncbi:MAG: hypothetical protein WBJ83_07170 [Thermacetogeniaceae bacterium]|nr:hypothetical protein [Syntrophomonadaceae bacterium]
MRLFPTAEKKNKKLCLLLMSLLTIVVLCSGCWDWVELNDITIISGIGLDETEEKGKIRLTVQVIRPAALSGGGGDTGGTGGGTGGGGLRHRLSGY